METILPDHLVLVAILKTIRDFEIARVLGWYRIPLQTAPKSVRVDWLAFYQTASFGLERWSVRYAAPVRGHELVRRVELLNEEVDHPRASEPYFKIQLGPVIRLPRPIPAAGWTRFTFLYTTGARMNSATKVRELRVPPSEAHDRLWKLLRERVGESASSWE